jgi:hypothetical protein
MCVVSEIIQSAAHRTPKRQPMMSATTLEEMLFVLWRDCLDSVADYDRVPTEAIQNLITETRRIAADAGWPATYTQDFFVDLAKVLKARSLGHPTTKQIIWLLEIETEFN